MASRLVPTLSATSRTLSHSISPITAAIRSTRSFSSTSRLSDTVTTTALPVRRPVGAFRGGLFGFLLGATAAGSGLYYYVIDEYKVSNELLTEDIYTLQSSVQRLEGYVRSIEERMTELQKK